MSFPQVTWRAALVAATGLLGVVPAAAQPAATTVQLPTFGVAVDAEGVLSLKTYADPTGRLARERIAAARRGLAGDLLATSELRKISLVRLEAAVQRRLAAGEQPDPAMRCLAGLTQLKHVFFYPETNDVVIAGPAEGWAEDLSGRARGIASGRPVLELQDLVVALRAFPPGGRGTPFVGCTIDPTPEAMQRLQQFTRQIPRSVPQQQRELVGVQIARGMREALGLAPIRVFGVPAESHFAEVLIEADYRMKRIGIGLETPPVKMASYLDLLGGNAPMQRWWFTPNYTCVKVTDDRQGMELVGEGVQLLSESQLVGPDGQFRSGAPMSKASELFATGFTRKYPELADKSPVFAQLRNLIDMLIAAAFVQQQDYYGRSAWTMALFADEGRFPVRNGVAPGRVQAAVNATWKRSRLIALAGGGVSIRPAEAFASGRVAADADGRLAGLRNNVKRGIPEDRWWWD